MTSRQSDTPGGVEGFLLPPAKVKVTYHQTGGHEYMAVAVTLALSPFVQAVATALGTKLADTIDTTGRDAVRRLLQRVRQSESRTSHRPLPLRVTVALTDEGSGARVSLADDLPAEAVAQLLKMDRTGSHLVQGSVFWHPAGARDGRWYVESDGQLSWVWDPAEASVLVSCSTVR